MRLFNVLKNIVQKLYVQNIPSKNILPLTVSQIKASNTGGSTWIGNTFTYLGVTWTILVDESNTVVGIKANGTATANANLYCNFTVPSMVSSGDYYFSGCPSGGSGSTYDIFMWDIQNSARAKKWDGTTASASDTGSSANNEVKLVDGHTYQLAMRVYSGYSVNNIVFYPMIRKANITDSSFVPYAMTNVELGNSIIKNNPVKRLGSITAGNSMTVNIPSSHFGLIILHGVYTSLTAILEVYCNASGSVSFRLMAVPDTATAKHFTTSTSTNTVTITNTDSVGSIAAVDFVGYDAYSITT